MTVSELIEALKAMPQDAVVSLDVGSAILQAHEVALRDDAVVLHSWDH